MKKQILNLGKALNKAEQKEINGGSTGGCFSYHMAPCSSHTDCGPRSCLLACVGGSMRCKAL